MHEERFVFRSPAPKYEVPKYYESQWNKNVNFAE